MIKKYILMKFKKDKIFHFIKYSFQKYHINNYLNNNQIQNIISSALDIMIEFINNNILDFIYNDYYDEIIDYTYEILYTQLIEENIISNLFKLDLNASSKLLYNCVLTTRNLIYKYYVPKRSYNDSYIRKDIISLNSHNLNINFHKIKKQIDILKSIKQPEQRSDDWYIYRNSILTASNIYKIFLSDSSQSQLILEKCEPINVNKFKVTNTNTPMHWGVKYEPISILYYEYINSVKVSDFGCIPHNKYKYIAASPDGIVCDEKSELFGRMLEIKNVVSREINGIPKMEYWIQMQIQMEVCDLNECDFLETKFIEYESKEEYLNDNTSKLKGSFIQFLKNDEPYYIYAPINLNNINSKEYNDWFNKQLEINKELKLIQIIYWKLEVISCILVLRNKLWFKNVLPLIAYFWEVLTKEKENGSYKNRYSKKKLDLNEIKEDYYFPKEVCLINI